MARCNDSDWDWVDGEDDGRFPYTPDGDDLPPEGECTLCGGVHPLPYQDGEVCASCWHEGGGLDDGGGAWERHQMGLVDF